METENYKTELESASVTVAEEVTCDLKEQPEILVLIGVPGSGKSTWSAKHKAASGKDYDVVSSDAVLDRIASEKGLKYSDVFEDYIGLATSESKRKFDEAVTAGRNIIFDQTNVSKKKRKGILQKVPKHYRRVAVVFNTEDKEVERRLKARAEATGKHIPAFVMKDMYSRWEAPTRDEGFDLIIKA